MYRSASLLLAPNVVNDPAAAVVPPIAGGDARYVENPEPLTVLLALSVVNAPLPAAVPPMDGGDARYVENPLPLTVLLALNVVNAPLFAEVLPIDGGDAKYEENPVPLTAPLALSAVNAPLPGVVPPIAPGDANVAPPSCAAFTAELQVKPVFDVHVSALALVEQLGTATAVGLALDAVALAITLFAAMAAIPFTPTPPHAGAEEPPDDTIAWPLVEPAGLNNWIGTVVAPNAADAKSAAIDKYRFFI